MRVFALLDHNLNLFIFKEGHFKGASADYDINSNNALIHVTNYSLQKYHPNFSKFEEGNEISFKVFQNYLDSLKLNHSIVNNLMPKIKEIIKASFSSVNKKINKLNRKFCFEIYGCDLVIDSKFNPYLLEINDNPGLSYSSKLLSKIVPSISN